MKISILISVKNESQYIKDTLESLLNQTHNDIEIVVIDDNSEDDTYELIRNFNSPKIKLQRNHGMGKVSAFNQAFELSSGGLICYMGGDDLLPPNSLEIRANALKNQRDLKVACYCKLKMFSKKKKYNGLILPKGNKGNVSGGTTMFSRALAQKIFPIPTYLGNEDMWTTNIIEIFASAIIHIPKPLYHYRIHESNSMGFNSPFKVKTEIIHKRHIVYEAILNDLRAELSGDLLKKYSLQAALETLRYNNSVISILFLNNVSLVEKVKVLAYSSSFLYFIKNKFYSLFSGR